MKPIIKDVLWGIIILCIIWYIVCNTFSSCMLCNSLSEGFSNVYASIYNETDTGKDVKSSIHNNDYCNNEITDYVWSTPDNDANISLLVEPNNSLLYYSKTEKRPDCCRNTCGIKTQQKDRIGISKTSGCPCMSNEQIRYLRLRGGNTNEPHACIGDEDNVIV